MDINYIILSNSLPFEESGYSAQTAHKLVKLLPLGLVHSTKGDFLVDNESFQSIRCKFTERQLQIPIDYEHQTLKDMQAPAAGWIKDTHGRNGKLSGAMCLTWITSSANCARPKAVFGRLVLFTTCSTFVIGPT